MYEEKGWKKDKVMAQANKKDKDLGERLRPQVKDCRRKEEN